MHTLITFSCGFSTTSWVGPAHPSGEMPMLVWQCGEAWERVFQGIEKAPQNRGIERHNCGPTQVSCSRRTATCSHQSPCPCTYHQSLCSHCKNSPFLHHQSRCCGFKSAQLWFQIVYTTRATHSEQETLKAQPVTISFHVVPAQGRPCCTYHQSPCSHWTNSPFLHHQSPCCGFRSARLWFQIVYTRRATHSEQKHSKPSQS